jgi:hypothetical protein
MEANETNEWEENENENENEEYPTYSDDEHETTAQGNIFHSAPTPSEMPIEPVAEVFVAPAKKIEEKQPTAKPSTPKPKPAVVATPEQPKTESRPTTGGKGIPVTPVAEVEPKAPVKVIVKKPKPEPALEVKPVEVVAEPEKKKIVRSTTGGKMPASKVSVAVPVEVAKPHSYIPPRDETEEEGSDDEEEEKQNEDKQSEDDESEAETPAPKKKKAPAKQKSKDGELMIKSSLDYVIKWVKISWDELDEDEPRFVPLFSTIKDKNSSNAFTEKPNNLGKILEKIPLPNYLPIAVHKENKGDIRVFPQYPIAIAIDNWRKSSRYLENFKKKQQQSEHVVTGINVSLFKSPRTTLSIKDMIDMLEQDCFTSHKKTACILTWLDSLFTVPENSIVDLSEDRLARYADNFKKLSGPFVEPKPRAKPGAKPGAKKAKESDDASETSKSAKKGKKDDDDEGEELTANDEKEEREYRKEKELERKRERERAERKIAAASSKNIDVPVAEVSKKRKAEHLAPTNGHRAVQSKSKEKTLKSDDDEDESDDESYDSDEDSEEEDSFIVSDDEEPSQPKISTLAKKNMDLSFSTQHSKGDSKKSSLSRKFDYIFNNWGMVEEKRQKKIKLHVEEAIHEIKDALAYFEQRKKQRKFASSEKKSSFKDGKKKRH